MAKSGFPVPKFYIAQLFDGQTLKLLDGHRAVLMQEINLALLSDLPEDRTETYHALHHSPEPVPH